MNVLPFARPTSTAPVGTPMAQFLMGASMEVMPRTAAKVANFAETLPLGTRVYIAHIDGTPIEDMVATAARLRAEGMEPMPHFPARIIADRNTLVDWIARYQGEADVRQALVLAGGVAKPVGEYHASMQLLDTGAFDAAGFTHLFVAGHPEGNRDIDPNGGEASVMEAARWKSEFAKRTDAHMAMVTQFAFEAEPIIAWADRLAAAGVDLPIHVGLAGPAKLQTLIKFAVACGVGPSLKVLQKRARDVTKLLTPFEPTEVAARLADHQVAHPETAIVGAHMFPLGGIAASATWLADHGPCASAQSQGGSRA
ncbi:MAG: methylenetetrahydrofolate reductase [Pseudomonadota bacterium]